VTLQWAPKGTAATLTVVPDAHPNGTHHASDGGTSDAFTEMTPTLYAPISKALHENPEQLATLALLGVQGLTHILSHGGPVFSSRILAALVLRRTNLARSIPRNHT